MFAFAPNNLSLLWLAALLILLPGLGASLVAGLLAIKRYKSQLTQALPA